MADERPDPAHTPPGGPGADGSIPAATLADATGAPDASSSPETVEAIPGFREACLDVLQLFNFPKAGTWYPDEDDLCKRLARRKGWKGLPGPYRLAVASYVAAVEGRRGALNEFLDRFEGAVRQNVTVTAITPEQAARMSEQELEEALRRYGIQTAAMGTMN